MLLFRPVPWLVLAGALGSSGCWLLLQPEGGDREPHSCRWEASHVCDEYLPVAAGDEWRTVQLGGTDGADVLCENKGPYGVGVFFDEPCPRENTLARCGAVPSYRWRRYFTVGFQGITETTASEMALVEDVCRSANWTFERPPYPSD